MKKIVTYLAVALSVALAVTLVPTAVAGCGFLQTIAQSNVSGSYGYVRFGPSESDPTGSGANLHAGTYWQLGLRANNADACGPDQWTGWFDGWYISANTSAGCVTNCIGGVLGEVNEAVVVLMDQINGGADANIVVALVPEEISRGVQFDMTPTGGSQGTSWPVDLVAGPLPAVRATASSRAADTVTVDLAFDSVAGIFYDGGRGIDPNTVITGYTVHTLTLPTTDADPGRATSAWGAVVDTVPSTSAALVGLTVDCSSAETSVRIVSGLMIDGYETEYVSAPLVVECGPTLADPTFKLIDRGPKKGPKRER